jgi:bacteriocin biosynthesis cyclodehydratase domain-containing protein
MTHERPLLKPWYRVAWVDGACLLEYGGSALRLEGAAATRLLPALLPLLDGTRTVAQIEAALGVAAAPAIEQALAGLGQAGVLTEGPTLRHGSAYGPATALAELLSESSAAGTGPSHVAESLGAATAAVCGTGETAGALARLLESCGVGGVERLELDDRRALPQAGELLVAAPDPCELASLAALNELALECRVPWLQVLPFDGETASIGPLFLPETTCCHRCFQLRRASTSGYRDELSALVGVTAAHGVASPVAALLAGLGAMIALRWLGSRDARLPGRLWALELWPSPSLTEHVVHRVPRCPACSQAERTAPPSPWCEAPVA